MLALGARPRKTFLAQCELLDLPLGRTLVHPGQVLSHAYFPETALISELAMAGETTRVEVMLVGAEGMVGASLVLGVDIAPLLVTIQGRGTVLRIAAADLLQQIEANPGMERMLRRYLYVQFVHLARATACTRFHVVQERLARWLLMMQDRVQTDNFHMTHEYLAEMLGVRRVGVTQAATALHERRLIDYSRGDIAVLDRAGLEAAACSCYGADVRAYRDVMGTSPA